MSNTLDTTEVGDAVGLKERILSAVDEEPGLTDRQLADALLGQSAPQQAVNQAARALVDAGTLTRSKRPDGRVGNFPTGVALPPRAAVRRDADQATGMTEDEVKAGVAGWLERDGWTVVVRWGHERGIDIEATRDGERWVIEAKGSGSLQPMRVNYFISMLGETLQRMDDPSARYSIALPDMTQYRGLWDRLPRLAKSRTTISILLVEDDSTVTHLE